MTALNQYQRLEALGLWRGAPDAQRLDVVVSLGDATLSIFDASERRLAHWSLPAIERRNPGALPALYAPGADAGEELELDDETMIDAIEQVARAVSRRRGHRGRLRGGVLSAVMAVLGVAVVLWLPGALVRHAVNVVPPATRADTGARLLRHLTETTGPACRNEAARLPLADLADRVLGRDGGQVVVLRGGPDVAQHLPGRIVVLNRRMIEGFDSPDVAAGAILAERLRARATDPIAALLRSVGPMAALHLLTRGEVSDAALEGYAERLLTQIPDPLTQGQLTDGFAEARLDAGPYLAAIAPGTPAQPVPGDLLPVLPDGAWVALQGICGA